MNYNKINIITIMDYNWSIPDIYSNGITKSFDEKLKKYEYNIKPNDKFSYTVDADLFVDLREAYEIYSTPMYLYEPFHPQNSIDDF
jgi:hypothetical protein